MDTSWLILGCLVLAVVLVWWQRKQNAKEMERRSLSVGMFTWHIFQGQWNSKIAAATDGDRWCMGYIWAMPSVVAHHVGGKIDENLARIVFYSKLYDADTAKMKWIMHNSIISIGQGDPEISGGIDRCAMDLVAYRNHHTDFSGLRDYLVAKGVV
jgi:hypothetical protein